MSFGRDILCGGGRGEHCSSVKELKRPRKTAVFIIVGDGAHDVPQKKPHELPWLDLLVIILKYLKFLGSFM